MPNQMSSGVVRASMACNSFWKLVVSVCFNCVVSVVRSVLLHVLCSFSLFCNIQPESHRSLLLRSFIVIPTDIALTL